MGKQEGRQRSSIMAAGQDSITSDRVGSVSGWDEKWLVACLLGVHVKHERTRPFPLQKHKISHQTCICMRDAFAKSLNKLVCTLHGMVVTHQCEDVEG